jgi:DNA-binding IclR family transcriptional regulator
MSLHHILATLPAATSTQIADAAGVDERYARQVLTAMVTAGLVEFDSASATYRLRSPASVNGDVP